MTTQTIGKYFQFQIILQSYMAERTLESWRQFHKDWEIWQQLWATLVSIVKWKRYCIFFNSCLLSKFLSYTFIIMLLLFSIWSFFLFGENGAFFLSNSVLSLFFLVVTPFQVLKVGQEVMVCDQVKFHLEKRSGISQSILLPWAPSVYQEVELKASGGCLRCHYSIILIPKFCCH